MSAAEERWKAFFKEIQTEKRSAQLHVKSTQEGKVGWKVIHQRKIKGYFDEWENYFRYIDKYPDSSDAEKERNTGIHWRGTMYMRYLGFIDLEKQITDPGRRFYKKPEEREQLLQHQVEKWHYCVKEFFRPGDRKYKIYPFFLLLKTLLEVGKRFTDIEPRHSISLDEFRFFIISAREYSQWKERVGLIKDYRNNPAPLKQILQDLFSGTSYDRIIFLLELSKFFEFASSRVYLKEEFVEDAERLIDEFEKLYKARVIPYYHESPKKYFEMLYSDTSLLSFYRDDVAIDKITDILIKAGKKIRFSKKVEEELEKKIEKFIKPAPDEAKNQILRILEMRGKKVGKTEKKLQMRQSRFNMMEAERYERSVGKALAKLYGKCQISDCGFTFPKGKEGERGTYCEAHHLQSLSNNGKDIPQNIVILCANHHRMFHYDDAKLVYRDDEKLIARLAGEEKTIFFIHKFNR